MALLRAVAGMANQSGRGVASHWSTAQGFDRTAAHQMIARGPADVATGEEVRNDSEVEPAFSRPDVGLACPVRAVRREGHGCEVPGDGPTVFAVRLALDSPQQTLRLGGISTGSSVGTLHMFREIQTSPQPRDPYPEGAKLLQVR